MDRKKLGIKKIWVLLVSTHLICLSLLAQNSRIDSLKFILEVKGSDTVKVNLLNETGLEYFYEEEFEEAKNYFDQALNTSKEIGFTKGQAYALKNIGLVEYYQGNYTEVFDYWSRSLQQFELIKDTLGIANMSSNIYCSFDEEV